MVNFINEFSAQHAKTRRLLDLLDCHVRKLKRGEKPNYELISFLVEYFKTFPDRVHHQREDFVYRRLKPKLPEGFTRLLDLEKEHEKINELTGRFGFVVGNISQNLQRPRDQVFRTLADFSCLSREHMKREEDDFFPLAKQYLGPQDWSSIAHAIECSHSSIVDDKFVETGDALYRLILDLS